MREERQNPLLWQIGFIVLLLAFTIYLVYPKPVGQVIISGVVAKAHIYQVQSCGLLGECSGTPNENVTFTFSNGANYTHFYVCDFFRQGMKIIATLSYQVSNIGIVGGIIVTTTGNGPIYTSQPFYSINNVPQSCNPQ